MTTKFQQAKAQARNRGVNPDGYFETYVYVWDQESEPRALTIDVWADEATLTNISSGLYDALANAYEENNDRYIGNHLRSMLRNNLVFEAECDSYGIHSVEELERQLDRGEIEVFPL